MGNPKNREKMRDIIRRNRALEKKYRALQAQEESEEEIHQSDKFDNWSTDPEDVDYLLKVGMEVY